MTHRFVLGVLSCGLALVLLLLPNGQAAPVRPKENPAKGWPKTKPGDRKRSANNLKQIALAFHNYLSAYNNFPAAAIRDAAGKPLLSWRVAILPFIEEDALYKEFRLNEAWDSDHNKKLLKKMPAIYGIPGVKTKPEHGTFYRVFVGPDAPFTLKGNGPRIPIFTDGTSNTILVVEAGEPVPWTKPDELVYDAKKPVPKLGGLFKEGIHLGMADGSVKFVDRKIKEKALRALITPSGGEVLADSDIPAAKPAIDKK
jgi:hypothetical protein